MYRFNFLDDGPDSTPYVFPIILPNMNPAGPSMVSNPTAFTPTTIAVHEGRLTFGQDMQPVNSEAQNQMMDENITTSCSTDEQVKNLQTTVAQQADQIHYLEEQLKRLKNLIADEYLKPENEDLHVLHEHYDEHNVGTQLTGGGGRGDHHMTEQLLSQGDANMPTEIYDSQSCDDSQLHHSRPSTSKQGTHKFASNLQQSGVKPKLGKTMKASAQTTGSARRTLGHQQTSRIHRPYFSRPSHTSVPEFGATVFNRDGHDRHANITDVEEEGTDSLLKPGEVVFEELEYYEDEN